MANAIHEPPTTSRTLRGHLNRWTIAPGPSRGPLVDRILEARGVRTQERDSFLDPSLKHLHDPSGIPGIDAAAERILDAARRREPIVVYGDYDVDGVSATAILVRVLRRLVPDAVLSTYVPHRVDEGYGLNAAAIEKLADDGARVIVSVDCGITAAEPARAAARAGVDLIITDHHLPGPELPPAFAVVHPRLPGSTYPFGDLCGAGVAFKLAWRLATMHAGSSRVEPAVRALLVDLLALASLGAVADVVPLLGENRVFARYGLDRIRGSSLVGLRALVDASGLEGEAVGTSEVGFILGPRLNACGRMGHARDAVELFLTDDPDRANQIALTLCALNQDRQRTERRVVEQAVDLAHARGMTAHDSRAIVLAHPDWHVGVLGIACSRLVDRFHRPTILLQRRADECHGSARSIEGYNLHAGLAECAPLLLGFGGHEMAAGLRLHADRLDAFTDAFARHAHAAIDPELLLPRLDIDAEVALIDLSVDGVRALDRLAPFGRGNPEVRVVVRGVRVERAPEPFGKHGKHASVVVSHSGKTTRVVGWRWPERFAGADVAAGMTLDAVLTPVVSSYSGAVEPHLCDLRVT